MTDERINERTFVNVELLSRLKIVAAMTKVARVPFSMKLCRGPAVAFQNFLSQIILYHNGLHFIFMKNHQLFLITLQKVNNYPNSDYLNCQFSISFNILPLILAILYFTL